MRYENPDFKLPERNVFTFRKEQYEKIVPQIERLIAAVEEFDFKVRAFDIEKPKVSKGSLSYTFAETINLVFVKGENDDPEKNNIDLSMKIPCLYDDFYVMINGRKKFLRYQLFDMPLLKFDKNGRQHFAIQTNIRRVNIYQKSSSPFIVVDSLDGKHKVPLALILFAMFGDRFILEKILLRQGYGIGEYFSDLGEVIKPDEVDIHTKPLTSWWDMLLHDIYTMFVDQDKNYYLMEISSCFKGRASREKAEDFIISFSNLLKFDILTQDLLGTDNIIEVILDIIFSEDLRQRIDNLDYKNKRIRVVEYVILRHFITNIHNMVIACRNVKVPKFNVAVSKILSDCNVSDIITYDFSINPIDQLTKIAQMSLCGPNGFNKENTPIALRDINDTMYGRVCPVDTPDRENCGVIQNLAPTCEFDNNYIFKRKQPVKAIASIPVSMVPFLEHDDQIRLQMASSQMRQSIALNSFDQPLISSGCDGLFTHYSDFLNIAKDDGKVIYRDYQRIIVGYNNGQVEMFSLGLRPINMENMDISLTSMKKGDTFTKGEIITRSIFTKDGNIVWGVNLKTAVMPYYGYNHEDGIVISERLLEEGILTSGHYIDLTFDISPDRVLTNRWKPDSKRNCMVEGYRYQPVPLIGDMVAKNEIYASLKHIPNNQLNFTDIFKEQTDLISPHDVQITNIELFANSWNKTIHEYRDWVEMTIEAQKQQNQKIIGVIKDSLDADDADRFVCKHNLNVFERTGHYKDKDEKFDGIKIRIVGYYSRPIQVGDKLANRHGNKGVISLIQERDKMPRDENGEPIDIIISQMGVPSRMNPGQLFELHMGEAITQIKKQCYQMLDEGKPSPEIKDLLIGFVKLADVTKKGWYLEQFIAQLPEIIDKQFIDNWYVIQPPFESVGLERLTEILQYSNVKYTQNIFDPISGQHIERPISVGNMYFSKLIHIADMKIAGRSVGITSPKTMQPLSGKKNKGGQKMGEMEFTCLISHDMPHTINENRTVKSDSIELKNCWTKSALYGDELNFSEIDAKPETNYLLESYIQALTVDF